MKQFGFSNALRTACALCLLAGAALGGCGIKGELKTPPPIWGDGDTSVPNPETQAEAPPSNP